jgi:5-methyltetrahydrofolate--homocysteine methyltransferase
MDEGNARFGGRKVRFLNLVAGEPDVARGPIMLDSSKWPVIEAGSEVPAGQGHRQFDQPEGR